ncbi:AAA family ATPase [Collinsella sp. AGMB00827]|uniref:AAA family ATPase n=1 Tax=Collinsella ureilytica TaxID=2869515 RepID=A0ABS7MIG7_9ACTN|nr:AAA family ATPase [Collinsella urealyticum]MBY4797163.1 AAA family ATPase [Collinsella urealyticum]
MNSTYIPRIVDRELQELLASFGAVLIEGPKWCGKTTTAQTTAASSLMLADPTGDFANRTLAELDPSLALAGDHPRLIDEWQEIPKLWGAVRFECDRIGTPGLFILTGSATPHDNHAPMHSGVGRITRLSMGTMTLKELGISNGAVSLAQLFAGKTTTGMGSLGLERIAELIVRGG